MTSTTTETSFWIAEKERGELIEAPLPPPTESELRIRTLYTGISRGTESLVFAGRIPASEHERMRAPFQCGDFTFPIKYGYMNVGQVEQGPEHLQGKTVFSLFPHQTQFNIAMESVTVLPNGIPPERAVLAANMETAVNALWDAQPAVGDKISVVGAGVLGSLVAYLASRIAGCEVELIDVNPERAAIANAFGIEFAQPHHAQRQRDLVVHSSATEQGLNTALELAGFEAMVLELSWYGDRKISINLGASFHSQRLKIKSSQVGHVSLRQRARWSYQRRLELALSLLADPCLDTLISGESPFSELPDTLTWLNSTANTSLCHRISYA